MASDEEKIDGPSGEKEPFFSASSDNSTASCGSSRELLGGQIGPYKLLSVLGEGGYGIVYLAEQHEPIRRRVALKITKPGMDTKQVIARFEAERQALALFDHPNIAHVYDAGTAKTGRPYFVMERVKGIPITEHCDQEKSGIEERLELFLDICDAIQYAHQKGIIHRDIKPSNILVSIESKGAVPKVIDFGVAKAISQPLTERTLYTEQGQFIGTPEYMSPEQADITIQDIDTRSDVYSLGVVLYELLTGVLPFDPETLRAAGIDRLRQIIREEEPKTPSTRLSNLGKKAVQIATKRRTEVGTLANRLHKELEWIPMKAMRKERVRRYRSVSELADDIQNYLNGNPLIAGPESITYKLKKYIRKRVRFVAAAVIVVMAVLVGLIVSTTMYFRAEDARTSEVSQRNIAEAERDRATKAEQQAEKRLVDLYEQQSRMYMKSGNLDEALVFLSEAHAIDSQRLSLRFLLDECFRKHKNPAFHQNEGLIAWKLCHEELLLCFLFEFVPVLLD
ncbi:serine/threonine protein kinase, partial [Planctomycetota bacterium]